MARFVINTQTYMRSLDKAYCLVVGFCLFDLSHEQYDLFAQAETASFDPETAVRLARKIGWQRRLDNKSLIDILTSDNIRYCVSTLKELELDSRDNTVWALTRDTLNRLFAIAYETQGIGPTFFTKALHPFCSRVIPILDTKMIPRNYPKIGREISQVETIRNDLMASGDALRRLQARLGATGIRLSRVRIFDMILWAKYRSDLLARKPGLKTDA